jgi:hypothetical protein
MSGPDAMYGEMPGFFPGRPGGERDEPLLDLIFDRRPIPPGAPSEMHDLARMLVAAAGPAEPGELAGETAVLAAFNRLASPASISPAALRPARRWLSGRPARARLPLATALVASAAGLGSMAAAYVGVLPGPIQQVAHVTMGAPPPHPGAAPGIPAVTSASPGAQREPSAAVPRRTHSAAPPLFHGRVKHQERRAGASGRIPGTVAPTCIPEPGPTQNPAKPAPTQNPAKPAKPSPSAIPLWPGSVAPSWPPRSPAAIVCLDIPTPTATPRPSG